MKSLSLTSRKGRLLGKQREFFRISKYARTFDRKTNKFVVNIAYETSAPEPSEWVVAVAEGFGLSLDQWEKFVVYDNVELKVGPADIVYVTGDSGSGKSVLLKALERDIRNDLAQARINVAEVQPGPDKPLFETVGKTAEEAMEILSKVGLGDAFLSG